MTLYTRATNMGLAFVKAAERSIIKSGVPVTQVVNSPKVHWIARRILTGQGKVGLRTEAGASPYNGKIQANQRF